MWTAYILGLGLALGSGPQPQPHRGSYDVRRRPDEHRLIRPELAMDPANRSAPAGGAMMIGQSGFIDDATGGNSSSLTTDASHHRGLQTCPPGTEDLMGTGESCISCAPGRFDDDNNPDTFCNACSAGQVAEGGTTFCVTCPKGTYAEPGTYNGQSMAPTAGFLEKNTGCFQCENGKFSEAVSGDCAICESGWYDDDSDPSTPCIICHIGSYTVPGVTECEDCVPGRYDHDRATNSPCTACDIGTYANFTVFGTRRKTQLERKVESDDDPQSLLYLSNMDPSYCYPDAGTRSMSTAECHQAFVEDELLQVTSCEECQPGQYDDDQDPSTPCIYCDAGKISWTGHSVDHELYGTLDEEENPTNPELQAWIGRGSWKADRCESCTMGMFAVYQWPSCKDCVGGSYTPENGMVSCDICEKGTMSLDKADSCIICGRGTFAQERNQSFCALCAVGQYGNGTKADSCVQCPPGTGHTKEGGKRMRSCCLPGTWADTDQGHDTCYNCANPGAVFEMSFQTVFMLKNDDFDRYVRR